MFFVSEEFLRKYEQGEDFVQTIDEAVKPGEGLFDQPYQSKSDRNTEHRTQHGTQEGEEQ